MQLCPQCGIRWMEASLGRCSTCVARDSKPVPASAPAPASWPGMTPPVTASPSAPTGRPMPSPLSTPPAVSPSAPTQQLPPAPPRPAPTVTRAPSLPPLSEPPHTPAPRSLGIQMPEDDLAPLSLTQVTGMGALGFHGVPERVAGMDLSRLKLTPFEGYLLSLVDGATYADDVVAASGLSTMDAASAFKRLKELGLLRFRQDQDSDAAHRTVDGSLREKEPDSVAAAEVVVATVELHRIMESAVVPTQEDHTVHLLAATEARDKGDFKAAREKVRMAWVISPDDGAVLALRDELESPAHAPTRSRVLCELAMTSERAMDPTAAARLYRQALDEQETNPTTHHRLALCILQAGLGAEEAEQHLRRTLELEPAHGGALRLLERLKTLR